MNDYFGSMVEFDFLRTFVNSKTPHLFQLSFNHISLLIRPTNNINFSKFQILGLGSYT